MKKKVLIPLCIVGAVAMLAGGFFGMMFLQKHLDKRAYEKTDTKLESIIEDSDFAAMDVDERKKKMDSVLEDLQDDGQISDIWFDENEKMYGFTYKSGILGAISLKDRDDSVFGLTGGEDHPDTADQIDISGDIVSSVDSVNGKLGFGGIFDKDKVSVKLLCSMQADMIQYFEDIDKNWDESDAVYEEDYNVTVSTMKNLSAKSAYILGMHGCEYNDKTAIVVYDEGSIFKYWRDLKKKDIVINHDPDGARNYLLLPSFFKNNYKENALKGTVMMVESCTFFGCDCRSEDVDNTYSDVFTDYLGADAVLGFKNSVNAIYAMDITKSVFDSMIIKGMTIESALEKAEETYGANDDIMDSENDKYFAYPVLNGNKSKRLCEKVDDISDVKKLEKKKSTTEADTTETTESTTVATTEQPSTEQENSTSDNSTDYSGKDYAEEAYAKVIDAFLTKRDEGLADDGHFEGDLMYDYPYGEYTCGAYNIFLMDKGFSNAGYTITDLDGDGIYEMIFAELGSSSVYDVFTLVDGEPKMILASWERCSLYYCGDYFYSSGSNGAASQVDNTYVIDGDAKEAERAFTELSDRTGELEYYYMDYSRINSDADQVSQEDYNAHIELWKSGMCEVPGLISFQEYVEKKSAENNRSQTEDYAGKVKSVSGHGDYPTGQVEITENEWKSAYTERINSVLQEYGHAYGYVYDLDGNGIPELIISDFGKHTGESYTYTKDGMVALGNLTGEFSHIYFQDGYFISMSSSGGSPGAIWVDVKKLDVNVISTINELEFGYKLAGDGKPEVKGAGSYDEAVSIIESYGMSAGFTEINYDGETYCQVDVDMSSLEQMNVYEDEDFVTAVENY